MNAIATLVMIIICVSFQFKISIQFGIKNTIHWFTSSSIENHKLYFGWALKCTDTNKICDDWWHKRRRRIHYVQSLIINMLIATNAEKYTWISVYSLRFCSDWNVHVEFLEFPRNFSLQTLSKGSWNPNCTAFCLFRKPATLSQVKQD